jgi:hypothetical protein
MNSSILLYFAIIGVAFLAVLRRPSVALTVAVTMFPLKQWAMASSPFFAESRTLTNLIAGSLVLLGVLIQLVRGRLLRPFYPAVAWPVALLFLYAFASVVWAPQLSVSLDKWHQAYPYLITMVFLAPLTVRDADDLRTAVGGIILLGCLLAVLLLFTVEWRGRLIVFGHSLFGDTIGGNPLTTGELGGNLVILGVLYRFRREGALLKALKWTAAVLGLALVVRSGSRGELGGAVIIAGAFWMLANPSKSLLKPLAGVILLTVLVIGVKIGIDLYWAQDVGGQARFTLVHMEDAYGGRLRSAIVLLQHWLQSPLTVLFGLGNSASYTILGIYPHIVSLEVLGEEGVLGFLIYVWIIVMTTVSALRTFPAVKMQPHSRILYVCMGALWAYEFVLINKQGSLLFGYEFFLYTILLVQTGQVLSRQRDKLVASSVRPMVATAKESRGGAGINITANRRRRESTPTEMV